MTVSQEKSQGTFPANAVSPHARNGFFTQKRRWGKFRRRPELCRMADLLPKIVAVAAMMRMRP